MIIGLGQNALGAIQQVSSTTNSKTLKLSAKNVVKFTVFDIKKLSIDKK